jgi:hypothetical protein
MVAGNGTAPKQTGTERRAAFTTGTVVLVCLANPREKFWGAILEVSSAGLSLRGIDLASFDGVVSLLRSGEPANALEVFFPMHRVERMETDLRDGAIPALGERFLAATGQPAISFLCPDQTRSVREP